MNINNWKEKFITEPKKTLVTNNIWLFLNLRQPNWRKLGLLFRLRLIMWRHHLLVVKSMTLNANSLFWIVHHCLYFGCKFILILMGWFQIKGHSHSLACLALIHPNPLLSSQSNFSIWGKIINQLNSKIFRFIYWF